MATSLPLARGFFNASASRPSEDQRREYIEFAESSIRKVFALSDCHRNSWIPVREKKGVAVFRNFGAARGGQAHKSNIAEVGGKSEVQASLDEVARAYAAHDDALFSRLMKKLNGAVMDAAVVATIVPRSPLAPFRYIGIKWFAVKTPTPLVSHRDYCCLEVQDKIVDGYGNEMYIRILNSIEIKECPSLENSHGLVRAKMLAGSMYRTDRAEPTLVRIHHVARFDPAGYFPSQWAYKTAESQLVSSVVQIKRVVEKQQMNACTFVDKKQWVPNHERQHCAVCSRQFGTFRPRHHCRCCGEVICGKCSIFKSVDVPGTTLKNVRICSICNMGVQKARPQAHSSGDSQLDDAMSDISTSSVTSSSTIAHNEMNLMDLYLSGPPGTPSAYSTASAQSNLSMRSTTSSSSRSFGMDGRAHRGNSGGSSTPGVARFFKGGSSSSRSAYNIFSSSAHTSAASLTSSTTPASRLPPGALFNETNTPRSYLGGGLTPHRMHMQGNASGFGTGSNSAASTPRAAASGGDASDAEDHERRKSVYKQNPLDLGYLRESVRVQKLTDTALSAANDTTNNDGDDAMQGSAEDAPAATTATSDAVNADVKAETKVEAEAETETGAKAEAVATSVSDVTTTLAVTIPMAVTISDSAPLPVKEAEAPSTTVETVTETEVASSVSTTPRRLRGESGTLLLPPAKMPRVEDDDVEMEDAASDNQQEETEAETAAHPIESIAEDTNQKASVADVPMVSTATNSIHADKSVDYEMDEPIIRSNATSTSTAESSTLTASAVEPPIAATPETPRKSFLGGLFSRASLETKPTAA